MSLQIEPPPATPARPLAPRHFQPWGSAAVIVAAGVALSPWGSPGLALLMGLALALTLGNPAPVYTRKLTRPLLQTSVVLLGFAMNLGVILTTGAGALLMATVTLTLTFFLGWLLGRLMKIAPHITTLLSAGTAICGGSAIAAVAVAIAAGEAEISVAMGTVFILNGVALYLFPLLGHALHLSPVQFGEWAGLAIHDVASVVGAAANYGPGALQTATTVKLARTLWIVPVALAAAMMRPRLSGRAAPASEKVGAEAAAEAQPTRPAKKRKLPIPWFIGMFLLAALVRSLVPAVAPAAPALVMAAKLGMNLTLLLIGLGLSRAALKSVGVRPLILGLMLWAVVASVSLLAIAGG
jgi:uncharacterized integral membrane protein (TIGR00698 family)